MKKMIFTAIFMILATGVFAQEQRISVIEPARYEEKIEGEEVQLVDVRTPEEYAEGHIEGAENFNFHSNDFLTQFAKFDKDEPIYIYCKSGNRSSKAAMELSDMGFKKIIDLKGGFLAWKEYVKE